MCSMNTQDEITTAELEILRSNLKGIQAQCEAVIARAQNEIERIDKMLRRITNGD